MPHEIRRAALRRRVVVVGARPGGLEAARVCAERGHAVVLFEKRAVAGGQIGLAVRSPRSEDMDARDPRFRTGNGEAPAA